MPWRDHRQQIRSPTIWHEYDPLECVPNRSNEKTDCVIGSKKETFSSPAPHACYPATVAVVIVLTAATNSQQFRKWLVCRRISATRMADECHAQREDEFMAQI